MDKKELEPLWLKQDERGRIRAALRLNMEGIEHELDKMRGFLNEINNMLPPELLKEWHKG